MVKKYKVISKSEKEIEDAINRAVAEGWVVDKFGYVTVGRAKFWALLVKDS